MRYFHETWRLWRRIILYLDKCIMYRYLYITSCCVRYFCVTSPYLHILVSYHGSYRYFCLIVVYTFTIHTDTSVSSHKVQTFYVTLWYALLFLYSITVSADISVTSWYARICLCHIKFSQKPAFEMRHCFYSSNWRMWRGTSYQTAGDPTQRTFFAAAGFIPGRYDTCPTVPNAGIITSQEPVNACPINCIYATPSAPPAITQQQWVFFCISLESSAHFKLLPLTGADCSP